VLLNHQSLDVSRLNGTGTFIWQTLMQETTWLGVINSVHLSSLYANTFEETEQLVRTFVRSLVDEGWITLASGEKKEDVLSTDD
jgi:Coenzyme PQQ synthesis protein D (PqqD)